MDGEIQVGEFRFFGQGVVGIEDTARDDRGLRFGSDQADSRFCGLKRTIGSKSTFREEGESSPAFERCLGSLHCLDIRLAIAIDGDRSHSIHPGCPNPFFPEGLSGEVCDDAQDIASQ